MLEENNLYGIAYNCPTLDRQDYCPLKKIEHFSFQEKVKWINALKIGRASCWERV